jgi:hypothetical protein
LDSGKLFCQTGETTVKIFVDNVNDKNPKFDKSSYVVYALESTLIGATALTASSAFDADRNADLEYSIMKPITARDKTGNSLSNRVSKGLSWAIFYQSLYIQGVPKENTQYTNSVVDYLCEVTQTSSWHHCLSHAISNSKDFLV